MTKTTIFSIEIQQKCKKAIKAMQAAKCSLVVVVLTQTWLKFTNKLSGQDEHKFQVINSTFGRGEGEGRGGMCVCGGGRGEGRGDGVSAKAIEGRMHDLVFIR